MNIVDTHCHAGENWFEPIEMLVHQMDSNGVDKAVLVQHGGSFDNSYLLECASRYGDRFVVAALVDSSRDGAPSRLADVAAQGAVAVRLKPGEPVALWREAAELGLVVSCQGQAEEFASDGFWDLVAGLPDLSVVLEHLVGAQGGEVAPYETFAKALRLGELPNTYVKVPGLGEISPRPSVLRRKFRFDETPPFIDMVHEAFGPRRMMWGSDYPPVSNREGYRNALNGVMEHPALRSDVDREWVMGKTALSVFGFGEG
jgi:L-fuconolactonase